MACSISNKTLLDPELKIDKRKIVGRHHSSNSMRKFDREALKTLQSLNIDSTKNNDTSHKLPISSKK